MPPRVDDASMTDPKPFRYDTEVPPGEKRHLRYEISETYLGDPIEVPVTVVNGEHGGPTVFMTAALHGDELNGVKVLQEVAARYDPATLHGTVVCIHVANVPGYLAQQRYIPIYDLDLNRSFPGRNSANTAERMANQIYERFIKPCDVGIDFHTSTRGRTNMLHVRADMEHAGTARLANAFGSHVIIASGGGEGMLRTEATAAGVPAITVEMGEAHRFQRELIDEALAGVESVFAEYGLYDDTAVRWPGWRTVIDDENEKTWIRADAGGIVDMHYDRGALVHEGDRICTITNPFKDDNVTVEAPFTGLMVGVLENPVVYPGNPLCHLVELEANVRRVVEREQSPDGDTVRV